MNKKDFWFDLPPELIAQTPIERRDSSRLLYLSRSTGGIAHRRFYNLPELLHAGDCLVLNDSRVLPARLLGNRDTGAAVEVLLLRDLGRDTWECITRPGRRTKTGARLIFGGGDLTAEVLSEDDGGNRHIRFFYDGIFLETLERLGRMPLPPYIFKELSDIERYQTVYSRVTGSAAAPTAGLHFTQPLLDEIRRRDVSVCFVTLHVGLGTFRPVKTDEIERHVMHSEFCVIPDETADTINRARKAGGRVIAVGTTSCRTLESMADSDGNVRPGSRFTDIFIYPGYKFRCVDGLVTNFHLPESTLIMLVSALAGRDLVLAAYNEAIREQYRFFSFGDCMAIL